jgi:hypothetical protein
MENESQEEQLKKYGNTPVNAFVDYSPSGGVIYHSGITLREYATFKAMQGLAANFDRDKIDENDIAYIAVRLADATIRELNDNQP